MDSLSHYYVWIIDVGYFSGEYFGFRYRARNVNGWGGFSPVSYVQAASVASPPPAPSLRQAFDGNLSFSILPSSTDNGSPIDAYYLEKAEYSAA